MGFVMSLRLVPVDSGKSIKLDKPVLLVGRNPDCDVILVDSRKVSRVHCLLAVVQNRVFIRDLGSTNGVWLNGHRVEREARMRIGDELSFADLKYELVNGAVEPEPPPPPKSKKRPVYDDEDLVDDDRSDEKPRRGEHLLAAPAFDERETRDREALPRKKSQDVRHDRLVALPDESDSFVVEPSLMRIPKPITPADSEDDLPLADVDLGDELPLANLLDEDYAEPQPKKLGRPKSSEELRELNEDDLLPNSRASQKSKRSSRDDDDSEPALQLDFSDG